MAFRFGTRGFAGRGKFRGPLSGGFRGRGRRRRGFNIPIFFTVDRQKSFFFDRFEWQGILNDGEFKALRRIGGWIRKTAKRSMRRRRKVSKPGKPPSVWAGDLKEKLFFHYQPGSATEENSVVVGPSYFPRAHRKIAHLSQQTIPRTLELGGTETFRNVRPGPPVGGNQLVTQRTIKILARPYMNPALEKAIQRGVIRDAFTGMILETGVRSRRVA